MRIVHVTPKKGCVRARRAARVQRDAGQDIVLVNGMDVLPDPAVLVPQEPVDGLRTYKLNLRYPTHVREAIRALEPDVIHAHELASLFVIAAKWDDDARKAYEDGVPVERCGLQTESLDSIVIYETHEYEQGRSYPNKSAALDRRREWQERTALTCVDHVIVPSPRIGYALQRDYGVSPPTVVLNSPPLPRRPLGRDHFREKWLGLKPEEKAIGFAGYVSPDRMLGQLAKVFADHFRGRGWRLFLFGEHAKVHELGNGNVMEIEFDRGLCAGLRTAGAEFFGTLPYPWPETYDQGMNLLDALSAMDVCFSGSDVDTTPNWKMGAPNKFFEYAMAGVPQVISEAIDPGLWMAEFGLGCTYNNTVSGLKDALEKAVTIDVRSRHQEICEAFAFDVTQVQRLEEAYAKAVRWFNTRMGLDDELHEASMAAST